VEEVIAIYDKGINTLFLTGDNFVVKAENYVTMLSLKKKVFEIKHGVKIQAFEIESEEMIIELPITEDVVVYNRKVTRE